MKKNIIYIIMAAMGIYFLLVSLLCSFIFEKIQFIAYKHSFTDGTQYRYELPLNIVFSISVIMIIAGIIGIVKTK